MQNFQLFFFLLYVLPGRSHEKVEQRFPECYKNSLIYSVENAYSFNDHGTRRLTEAGELKLFALISGFIATAVGIITIATCLVAAARFLFHLFI